MLRPALLFLALSLALSPCCLALPADELTPAQRAQLNRDKLIIGAKDYPQIYTLYVAMGRAPENIRFITSDAALAAYHGLFEDSFRELELRRAARLRGDLEKLYNECKPSPKTKEKTCPLNLIQHILGPALVILGTPATVDNFSENLLPEIKRQVALIRAAEIKECPPWLDYRDDSNFAIDYRRCKPVSFYAGNPALADYHRVVRWLQLVPLRATNDDELTAWARMAGAANPGNLSEPPDFVVSFTGLGVFVGPIADRTIVVHDRSIQFACETLLAHDGKDSDKVQRLAALREALLANARQNPARSAINDEIRTTPEGDAPSLSEIRFRVMPTHALPDAEIISAFLDAVAHSPIALLDKIRPNGLTVAAFLGSSFAHERMPKIPDDASGGKWESWNKRARQLMLSQDGQPRTLYADYIDVLRTLNTPPVKEAPAFMRSLPWQIKTCQTQLASWAQIRHTYTLQAKLSVETVSGGIERRPPPPGFVEPNPAFWREYVRLVERTIMLLDANGVFAPSAIESVQIHRATADKIEAAGLAKDDANLDILRDSNNRNAIQDAGDLLQKDSNHKDYDMLNFVGELADCDFHAPEEMRSACKRAVALLRAYADKMERGEMKPEFTGFDARLADRWNTLATLSRQIETILAKQLDEIELTDSERYILMEYGHAVQQAMGDFGAIRDGPRDTAPRWAEVAHDPNPPEESLAAATGRARALFVLYPWHGRELLCTGAVLSYYEEWAPTKRLTDDEWKQKLDSANPPPPPAWLAPILAK